MTTDEKASRLAAEIAALEEERNQLEAALPPHGLKPGHLRRLEEVEELIEAKRKELAERS
ncbi:MAG: hypothetical protein AB1896_20240 [Thermodesulfobacteriota bacterium]